MSDRVQLNNIQVAQELYDFVNNEALPKTKVDETTFWEGFATLVNKFSSTNKKLLLTRNKLQSQIDEWHQHNSQDSFDIDKYKNFLVSIGYIVPEANSVSINTENVDQEITETAGPQLVVPVSNPRYALNAANARWGSLYDALYGTDVISESGGAEKTIDYNEIRGKKVIDFAKQFLDAAFPLANASHTEVTEYKIVSGENTITAILNNGTTSYFVDKAAVVGYKNHGDSKIDILLQHNGLHVEIQIDKTSKIGKSDLAGIKDIILESAITTIIDFEDSVAAVDVSDKVACYRNWLGLNTGSLTASVQKNNTTFTRKLASDRNYIDLSGKDIILPARSLLFVRTVGILMTSDAVLDIDNQEIPEHIMDTLIAGLCAIPGISGTGLTNSRAGSIYMVKPKLHGPDEVEFIVAVTAEVEKILNLPTNTIKLGIMDEERRTTINLESCIAKAKDRVIFINTGFLDRTGDEIHTSMLAGPMVRKDEMKQQTWINAYEDNNVNVGLRAGFSHRAQIGKGMWSKTDLLKEMLETKGNQLLQGATTAWVPSPTAATLHALHYHQVPVFEIQTKIGKRNQVPLSDILTIPLAKDKNWLDSDIQREVENNCQSILGYVVRWIDQGVGCSKVPDINNVGLMEDRATLRISSQILANWLQHKIISEQLVISSLEKMAKVVDKQNETDPNYHNMAPDFGNNIAFQAAKDLILLGFKQPNGYTEPILHAKRKEHKAKFKSK